MRQSTRFTFASITGTFAPNAKAATALAVLRPIPGNAISATALVPGGQTFTLDDNARWRLLNGLDDISLTLQNEQDIAAYEAGRPSFKPRARPA